jgi:hypothetical protein
MPILTPLKKMPINAENLASLESQNRYNSKNKNFADIRIKMGDKKLKQDGESMPSEISENAWDELPKY